MSTYLLAYKIHFLIENMIHNLRNELRSARRYFSGTPLKTKWLYVRREILRQFDPLVPRQLWLGVTYRCQCRCVHCFLGPKLNNNKDEMSSEAIFSLIREAKCLGFLEIIFFGGEPLLRKDISELVKYASERGLLTSLITNGVLLDNEKAKELKEAGLSICNVSLDSASSKEHNSLRGLEACFEKAVEGINHVLSNGIKCSIFTYAKTDDVREGSLEDLRALISLGRSLGIWKMIILFPMASGNWICGTEHMFTKEEREKVRALHNPPFTVMEFPREDGQCKAGKRMIYITPQGDVSPCPAIPDFFGNATKESMISTLKRLNKEFIDLKPKECGECMMNISSFRQRYTPEGAGDPKK